MSAKGVIFDLDGVLVDTARFHYMGWKKLADEIDVPFDEKKNERLKGLSRRDSLLAMLGYTPDEGRIEELCGRKNIYYLQFVDGIGRGEMLPGAMRLIEDLGKSKGWKQAVASSSRNAKTVLRKLDIERYFEAIVDGTETKKTKPDPELFLKAASRLGLAADKVVVFEDAESGVRAAKNGGMLVVGIGDGEILRGADLIVKDLSEVDITMIEGLFRTARKEA